MENRERFKQDILKRMLELATKLVKEEEGSSTIPQGKYSIHIHKSSKTKIREQIKELTINEGAHTITGLESTINNFEKCSVEEMIGNKLPYSVVYKNGLLYAVSDIRSGRCKGNSTRQINDTYDLFFSLPKGNKCVGFEDHSVSEYGEKANYISMKILTRRLLMEGRCVEYKSGMDIQTSKVRVIEIGSNYIKALNF